MEWDSNHGEDSVDRDICTMAISDMWTFVSPIRMIFLPPIMRDSKEEMDPDLPVFPCWLVTTFVAVTRGIYRAHHDI
jgi:hypothetical protein